MVIMESLLVFLFNWTVAHVNGHQKQHTIIWSPSTGVYPNVFLVRIWLLFLSVCIHKCFTVTVTDFFCGPGYWHLVFPSNIDTHLFKSIDTPIMTDSFGGKKQVYMPTGTKEPGFGGITGRMKWWDRIIWLTDHKTLSSNILKRHTIMYILYPLVRWFSMFSVVKCV